MHTLRSLILIAFLCVNGIAYAQQTASDDRYKISLTINGTPVEGSQELAKRLTGKTPNEQRAILDQPFMALTYGHAFQLVVKVTDPTGKTVDYTKSTRLLYEHFGCLTVSANGFVSVIPSSTCDGADHPSLWIAFLSSTGAPISYNQYQFRVTR